MTQYHEPVAKLDEEALNMSRALNSLKEEIEAVDWYNQRVVASNNPELKAILAHNRNEEIEHACMLLEWLRRNVDEWDEEFRTYLFTKEPIVGLEGQANHSGGNQSGLNIGDLK